MAERRHRPRAVWTVGLAGAAFALLFAAGVSVASAPSSTQYDLTVIVLCPDVGPAQLALSYPRVMDHEVVTDGIRALAKEAGTFIDGLEIKDDQRARGMPEEGTAATFSAMGLLREQTGALPVGPIIRSLPAWHRMRLVFVVGDNFRFLGPVDTEADGFAVRLINRMKPYEYDVERMTGRLAPRKEEAEGERPPGALLPVALIGLPAGVIVGWLLGDVRPSRNAPRPRR